MHSWNPSKVESLDYLNSKSRLVRVKIFKSKPKKHLLSIESITKLPLIRVSSFDRAKLPLSFSHSPIPIPITSYPFPHRSFCLVFPACIRILLYTPIFCICLKLYPKLCRLYRYKCLIWQCFFHPPLPQAWPSMSFKLNFNLSSKPSRKCEWIDPSFLAPIRSF